MKPILALAAIFALAACGDDRPASQEELRGSHQNAAGQAEKAFDKENPADPATMQAPPAK